MAAKINVKHCLFVFLFFVSVNCFSQQTAPLNKLHAQVSLLTPLYISSPYHNYSARPLAPRLQMGANLYNGEIALAITFNRFNSDSLPGFSSTLFTLGYQYNFALGKKIWIKPGIAFGNNFFKFFNDKIVTAHRTESELLFEGSLYIQTRIYKKLCGAVGAGFQRTLLYHPLDMVNLNLNLCYYFDTPGIVKKFIN